MKNSPFPIRTNTTAPFSKATKGEQSDTRKSVFVTGAGGYVGSVLIPQLLDAGYHVKALDRFFFGREKLASHDCLEIIEADCRDYAPELLQGVEAVIDLVAISNDPSGEHFQEATWQINADSRIRTATLAKEAGVSRYIFPSSCSVYGFQDEAVDESSALNPLTTYAKANLKAENGVRAIADDTFTVTIMRQATLFGVSPRMRFDLAINGMTQGAWQSRKLPLMRDGSQFRPMLHVADTADAMLTLLQAPAALINGETFNIGGDENNCQIGPLGESVAKQVGQTLQQDIPIEWYGDPDHRSYRVDFSKIQRVLGWQPKWSPAKGVSEIVSALADGTISRTPQTLTLGWYQSIVESQNLDSLLHPMQQSAKVTV